MTITARPDVPAIVPVAFDLYRDIHKAIRNELFETTLLAGRTDPSDRAAGVALAARVGSVGDLLVAHAEHEDGAVQPAIEEHLPVLAERIERDHARIETRIVSLREWAADAIDAFDVFDVTSRFAGHRLYVELAAFTATYLEHQDVEERLVMPALEAAVGVDAVLGIHLQIVGTMPPEQLMTALAIMIPAMNVDDRTELLGGMQLGAPAEVLDCVWGLTQTVLAPPEVAVLAARLGVG